MLSTDPFSATGFKLNIVLLTFAPAFLTAGIYLLLKHLTLSLNPRLSPLKPSLYTPIFVSCDLAAIILQGAGGAISAAAANGTDKKLLDLGVNVMIAGISSQVENQPTLLLWRYQLLQMLFPYLKIQPLSSGQHLFSMNPALRPSNGPP